MEVNNIMQFLEDRTILVTGGTGFLAKVMVEKILRVQPNVRKLYLLIRACDLEEAIKRFQMEVCLTLANVVFVRVSLLSTPIHAMLSNVLYMGLAKVQLAIHFNGHFF
ncbi:putative alcohol-forming fatty acyl-CoA reductase [Helianthus annuus]|uniref:Fatty acyl-CoA reductase n=1 Tax=Helianthus annuus TaxID=4232 RepID=A0A251TJP5_HELAN|nr:putative alcohol-forming fatty acyl-CoA reductase [Helianthus annuus]KAJ0514066.1 putative alcohol-forming fatty acyl-CoA reductase [Helianthus annuus]KAJ0530184.1 putative alcohol-forming fatty acyl-CoA reductase [Helianthus annuus]KAJ0697056.1 putative alcohol-forming fatty acyl-CoA reductase [Helianthus annuus]KAJ0700478.1 putative alcohol-forming fatty acyl-CoA reductase [Helianthus annuus]